jgi:superfamily I DNA/RNA helicase
MSSAQPAETGSPQQVAIWDAFLNTEQNIIIDALAGTGKTFTGVEGLRPVVARGLQCCFLAFNKSIATELQNKVPQGAKAGTFHSAGFGAVRNHFQEPGGNLEVDADRTWKMLPENMPRQHRGKIVKLVSICKNTLCDAGDKQELLDLCAQYDIDLYDTQEGSQPGWQTDESAKIVLEWTAKVLEDSKTPTGTIDFDDMIWLPVIWGLPIRRYDFLVVDESQDLNRTQQELALMIGKRIIMVGDKHQAIYGFRGADVNSMANMAERLAATARGLLVLPLTVTRRCPRLVTAIARQIVPELECLDDAPIGHVCFGEFYLEFIPDPITGLGYDYKEVEYTKDGEKDYCQDLTPKRGDMVLCRTNAPLVQMAYGLIRQNVPCKIQGRDFGKNLEALIKQLVPANASTIDLLKALLAWAEKERAKIEISSKGHPSRQEVQMQTLSDKTECIEALCDGLDRADQVVSRIQVLFQDVNKTTSDIASYVLLSSVHRAKGLEARVVRIIRPELLPHPMARLPWQKEQEMNLKYVAETRSLEVLHLHD